MNRLYFLDSTDFNPDTPCWRKKMQSRDPEAP